MKNFKADFLLRDDITYLNFGSFGACPKPVFDDYIKWQYKLESEPVQFIAFDSIKNLQHAREALGSYIHCDADDIVLVTNPSYAVNIIAKSFTLKEGDEILSTNNEYGACDRTWNYYCKKAKAKYVQHAIKFPIENKEEIIENFFRDVNENTKLIFISYITSSTGLRLPVEEICAKAKALGIMTFVDGAHAPGQLPLNLNTLQADIYTGACHKWMMTPKGCSFLYVKKEHQHLFDPLVVSWGYESAMPSHSQFLDYHQMQGTRDFSAMLTIPKAIEYMQENDWPVVSASCRKMVIDNAPRFLQLCKAQALCPINEDFIAQLFSIPVTTSEPEKLQRTLYEKYKIEIPVTRLADKTFIRYSIQAFNTQEDLDRLYNALKELM